MIRMICLDYDNTIFDHRQQKNPFLPDYQPGEEGFFSYRAFCRNFHVLLKILDLEKYCDILLLKKFENQNIQTSNNIKSNVQQRLKNCSGFSQDLCRDREMFRTG